MDNIPLIGAGFTDRLLDPAEIQSIVAKALTRENYAGQRVLVIIPDSTRTMPMGLFFRVLCDELLEKAARLDFLVALGTHPLLSEELVARHLGISSEERRSADGRLADRKDRPRHRLDRDYARAAERRCDVRDRQLH